MRCVHYSYPIQTNNRPSSMPVLFNYRGPNMMGLVPGAHAEYEGAPDCMMDPYNFTVKEAWHRNKMYGKGVFFERSWDPAHRSPSLTAGSVVSLHGAEGTRLKPCPLGFYPQAYENGLQLVIGDQPTKDHPENRCYNLLGSYAQYLKCADDPLETNYAWQQNCEFIEDVTYHGERVLNLHILKAIRSGSQMIVAREGYLAPPA
jgi:hypothetical protein